MSTLPLTMFFVRIPLVLLIVVLIALLPGNVEASSIGGSGQVRYGVQKHKGFDTCAAPATATMQAWWTHSPYYDVGIYIGGENRACSQPNLNSTWTTATHNQGWNFYLVWAGRQAPCSSAPYKIGLSPAQAAGQGSAAATAAKAAASGLGFNGKNVYYLDIEAYDVWNGACRSAVNAFVAGWDGNLQNSQDRAGVYGSGCGTSAADWATIQYVPNVV